MHNLGKVYKKRGDKLGIVFNNRNSHKKSIDSN